jgi:hypothetical protein
VCQWVSKAVAYRLSHSIFGVLTLLDEQMSHAFVRQEMDKSAIVTLLHVSGVKQKTFVATFAQRPPTLRLPCRHRRNWHDRSE